MISLMLLSLNENPSFKNKPRSALVDWKQLWMESNRRTRISAPSDGNSRVVASPFNQAGVLRQPAVPGFPAGARASLHMTEGKAQGHLLDAVMCDVSRSLVVGVLDTDVLVEEAFTCPALNYLLECDVDTTLQRMCRRSPSSAMSFLSGLWEGQSHVVICILQSSRLVDSRRNFSLWIFVTICSQSVS